PAYKQGQFQVQDPNAALAVALLDPQPGEHLLDLCSAPGGKATQAATAMDDRGRIVAADISPARLSRVHENAQRLGLNSLQTVVRDGTAPGEASFDRVLADVPCSATGVIGRPPDVRWRREADQLPHLAARQRLLLERAYEHLKPGGVLVYSTCSLEEEENEKIVEQFLAQTPTAQLQRADIQDLVFADSAGQILPVEGRLEIIAWPDRLAILLEIAPDENRETCRAVIRFTADGEVVEQASTVSHWAAGETQALHAVLFQRAPENEPAETLVQAFARNGENPLSVTYDDARGWHLIDLPANPVRHPDRAHLDRIRLNLENSGDSPKAIRLNFAQHDKVPTITGIVPLLRDSLGNPTGIPVQISKNWHQTKGKTFLYQGPWLHALTAVELPPQSQIELEFCLARDFWGELPLASHAQLCLIGWGVDQLWDQAAIGSWGESICYDPDVCLNRSVIDDVRPLMVTQMKTPDGKWGWTNNVGGGDFLVYFDRDGDKQYLTRMRSAYLSQGPNLTDVVYSGVSADGKIAATMRVMTPRCDDLNRAYHYFRYDVLKPVEFSRLAFYQVGADNYNDHQFGKLARGDETGLLEEWVAQQGGLEYHRRGIPCPGNAPWFSLHEGVSKDEKGGAWANRGLVIRSWKARLGGKEAPPTAASYGTQNRPHSCNIELTPPPDVTQLQPGDFVEAWVEFLVLPQSADDYYGPNESLRGDLQSNGNTWKPVFRQAAGNALQIETENGTLLRAYPPRIEVGQNREAEIAIAGGIGYLPLTFSGLSDQRGWQLLYRNTDGEWITIDQSAFGNDFWQIGREGNGKYAVTFNVSLDARDGVTREKRFRLVRSPQGDQ
ncbi:MAG: RsmB/NOP family class I SAM-dependent RNA methyltransferase, partial [Gemmatimonadetes bacterium]|nr:RsmB/NOP family class I SAM-dependent RNA methyltransferase [Gemmatimonadota bacterium]